MQTIETALHDCKTSFSLCRRGIGERGTLFGFAFCTKGSVEPLFHTTIDALCQCFGLSCDRFSCSLLCLSALRESKTTLGRRILRRLHNLFDLFVGMYRIFESGRLCLGKHLHDCLFGFVHTIHTLRSISVKIGDVIFLFDRQRVIKQKQKFLSFALDFYLGAMSIFANGNILAR